MKELIRPVLLALTLMCSQAACVDLTGVGEAVTAYIGQGTKHFPGEGARSHSIRIDCSNHARPVGLCD